MLSSLNTHLGPERTLAAMWDLRLRVSVVEVSRKIKLEGLTLIKGGEIEGISRWV